MAKSGRLLAAEWLRDNVKLGEVFNWNDLSKAYPDIPMIRRRGRELRTKHDWDIRYYRTEKGLAMNEARLVKIGDWPKR
jgi:hypothetical protein